MDGGGGGGGNSEEQHKVYPFNAPDDFGLRYNAGLAEMRMNPKGIQQKAKFCPVCDFPIAVRIAIFPCQHYFCFNCYAQDTFQCRLCDTLIKEYKRLDDKEPFHSCDADNCFKYFDSQQAFDTHNQFHSINDKQPLS